MLHIVPEEILERLSKDPSLPFENNFLSLLSMGKVYKKESLTPIYIYNSHTKQFLVTSEESLSSEYH
mgnify:FL=1